MSLIRALDNGSISKYCRSGHLRFTWWGLGLAAIVLLTSCNSKKYLQEGQSFLMDNKITIKSRHPVPNKSDLYENLIPRYSQKQTKVVAGIPRHTFYYQYQKKLAKNPEHKKWDEERLIKNRPVIFDSLKTRQTCTEFEHYLALRGYRYSSVTYKVKTQDKVSTVYYRVDPGPRLYVDSFLIMASDTSLQQLIDPYTGDSFIKKSSPLDIQLFNQEKQRVVHILQNAGYATFDDNFISSLEVDTSNQRVNAIMRLNNPSDSTFHAIFFVGDISIYPDYNIARNTTYQDTIVHGINYYLPDSAVFTLEPEAIERNLFIHPGELTQKVNYDRTIKNLGRTELIKFVNPSGTIDTLDADFPTIDYSFYLTRNKKINFDFNAELTYSNIASEVRKSFFGTSLGATYRDRNIFKQAEVLNISTEVGFDFNFFNKQAVEERPFLNSLNLGLGGNLSFQRFIDPLAMYRMIGYTKDPDKKAWMGTRLRKWFEEDASTGFSLGTSFVRITNLYDYFSVGANLNYVIQPDPNHKLTINRIGLELFLPTAYDDYQMILDSNRFLAESFGNQLYTGFFFRSYLSEFNSKSKARTGYFRILHSAELSGLEMFLINSGVNLINQNTNEIVLNPGGPVDDQVRFSQFVKGELDIRYYRDLTRNTQFSLKFNTGIATSFGPYTDQVPYPKQFFVGGALSNRAWQIRELGPGGYEDTTPHDPALPFYQTGDFKMDISAELRFKLFWYFKGAIFMDAANVWILQVADEITKPADLNHFIDEFGIGYGFGIRLDVEFFILRLDLGYKLHNPYPVEYQGKTSRWLRGELVKFPGGAEPQIAVGLPF